MSGRGEVNAATDKETRLIRKPRKDDSSADMTDEAIYYCTSSGGCLESLWW
jgi:hypothetical protein